MEVDHQGCADRHRGGSRGRRHSRDAARAGGDPPLWQRRGPYSAGRFKAHQRRKLSDRSGGDGQVGVANSRHKPDQRRVRLQGRGRPAHLADRREADLPQALRIPGSAVKPSIWCKYDLSSLGRGFLFGALTGFKDDPGQALVNLKERGNYEERGDETLFGINTTHYAGSLDLAKVSEQEKDPFIREALSALSAGNRGKLPVEVWLSSDNVLRRMHATFNLPPDGDSDSGAIRVELTFDFSDYGIKVRPPKPPKESRVVEPGTHGCPNLLPGVSKVT
jgi:hypothetical protein